MNILRPSITARGFRTAVKDYNETSVIEELAANSYDEDASNLVVLLDTKQAILYIIDDGKGFTKESIYQVTTLGGGNKLSAPFSRGNRAYLGSYGYGLKSTLNIADKIEISSISSEGFYNTIINWNILDEALKPSFEGFQVVEKKKAKNSDTGTIIKLHLKNPTTKSHLDDFGAVLSNLPNDNGKFNCYYGLLEDVGIHFQSYFKTFKGLASICKSLAKESKIRFAKESFDSELQDTETEKLTDKEDKTVSGTFYFAGIAGDKIKPLKSSLRGIYIRIHGRLLKHNFSEDRYTYGISKYTMFKHALRVEISIDWLRDQITLSRDGLKFSNDKLEKDFKSLVGRLIARFIKPKLDSLNKRQAKGQNQKLRQRLELAEKRAKNSQGLIIKGLNGGFKFIPETDAEVAILLAQKEVISKVNSSFELIDYNDQAPFDCILYDRTRRQYVYTELEPTLMEFVNHNVSDSIQLIITWSLGKWRIGAKKKAKKGYLELIHNPDKKRGHYKLLEYTSEATKKPKGEFPVIVLEELMK